MTTDARTAGRHTSGRSKMLRSLLALILAATILAACGDDDDSIADAANEAGEQVDDASTADVQDAANELSDALDELGLTSLASAVEALDLGELIDVDEYTFFAPSDEAFTSLSADGITDLLADPELLVDTLQNHLVEGKFDAEALSGVDEVTTRHGSTVTVDTSDGVRIGDAKVTTANVPVGDAGIIHIVDALLVPAE